MQLKQSELKLKEMRLLLDMYKSVPKEHRDKAQFMASEKKLRAELDDARIQVKLLLLPHLFK